MKFEDIASKEKIYLYAGDMDQSRRKIHPFIGLSLSRCDKYHITHDITNSIQLPSGCVDIFQAEDVIEHIEYKKLTNVLNEVFRVLKPEGLFRLSTPDYRCDFLQNRSLKNEEGNIFFDPGGGGKYDFKLKKVVCGGHLWFPKHELVLKLLNNSRFTHFEFLHYYDCNNTPICQSIDYSFGYISRTPDNDNRVKLKPLSIVVDCYKSISLL